jgi:hypothetical protein
MFFSVKYSVKIAGKVYSPCICYALPETLRPTIEKLIKEGKAYTYDHKVFFQNGKVLEKKESKKTDSCEECDNSLGNGKCLGSSKNGLVDTTGEHKCFEKKGKKEKKVPRADTVVDIPSPEEIADNLDSEGF